MQEILSLEREAMHRLPALLADLLDEPDTALRLQRESPDGGIDAVADSHGRRWLFEVKSSSRPGLVASAAGQLAARAYPDAVGVLVVPFMTPAGAKAAAERGLNWLDLSGNAHIRDADLYISVQGRPNQFVARGRPSSPFAPKSSRITRMMLLEPQRWWRQKELADLTHLDDGHVSRIVRRLVGDLLLETRDGHVRPSDPSLLLDAWSDEYRFERHDVIVGHASGAGIELARQLHHRLDEGDVAHAFTGLPAAWLLEPFARFRLNTVYVHGDPRDAAEQVGLRRNERGANVQLVGPNDQGVFAGQRVVDALPCVSPVQVYLDLRNLPERADEAAGNLREHGLLWDAAGR
jgi:hypothetical protein